MKIKGFENYSILENGKIINDKTKKHINGSLKNGYIAITLKKDGVSHQSGLHRILMLNFKYIEGCEDLVVNHKDGNKLNNDLDNLEWVTSKENTHHALNNGLKNGKAIPDNVVLKIRQEYIPGRNGNYKELLKKYDLKKSMFYAIIKNQFRKYLTTTEELNLNFKKKETKACGEDNGMSKLNWEAVDEIRFRYKNEKTTLVKLGNEYGVYASVIGRIVNNKSWIKK